MGTSLADKVALVTGASSGIGAAATRALLGLGARVIVTARRTARLRDLEASAGQGRLLALDADLTDAAATDEMMRRALEWSGGGLDLLLNNAGLSRSNPLEDNALPDLRLMLETNVLSLAHVTQLALPALKRARGMLINIASSAAKSAPAGAAVYAASKAAVAVFSDAMRKELLPHGVRVTTVFPGFVATEFFDALPPAKQEGMHKAMAAMEALTADDVADLLMYVVTRPPHVSLNDILIRPSKQP